MILHTCVPNNQMSGHEAKIWLNYKKDERTPLGSSEIRSPLSAADRSRRQKVSDYAVDIAWLSIILV